MLSFNFFKFGFVVSELVVDLVSKDTFGTTSVFDRMFIRFLLQKIQSSEEELLLRSVDLDTTGLYRCEISGEAPLFQTASREAVLAVVGKIF